MGNEVSAKFKTPVGTLAFSNGLFKPSAVVEGGPLKFSCTLIFDNTPEVRKVFQDAIISAGNAGFGDKFKAKFKAGTIKNPILAGDGPQAHNKQVGELYAEFGGDKFFIRPNTGEKQPPVIRARELGEQTPADETVVYSGCKVWAVLHCYSWTHKTGGEGVSFGLDMICKTADGERLGGGGPVDPGKWWEPEDNQGGGSVPPKGNGGAAKGSADDLFG